jgi:hypothetical protein
MDIQQLTRCENVLMGKEPGFAVSDGSEPTLRDLNWDDILRQYLTLAREQGDLEALKRALFLAWYYQADPEWVTGIGSLDPQTTREVLRLANDWANRGQLDKEMIWMLSFYCTIVEWFLSPDEDALRSFSVENKHLWMTGCLESSFDNRGQMGEYWKSILNNQKTRVD